MTTSKWSKEEIARKYSSCSTFKEVIDQIEKEFSERGEVICEISLNGLVLTEEDETRLADNSAAFIEDLAVRTNQPTQLIHDALTSAHSFIPELEQATIGAAELFRGTDLAAAQKSFNEALEGCQWLIDTLMHLRGAASGIGKPISQAERWFSAEQVIARAVNEVTEAFSASDYVLVADVLEYELTGALAVWREAINAELAIR